MAPCSSPRATPTRASCSRSCQNDTILRYGDYQLRVDHPLAGGQATLFAFGALDDIGWTNLSAADEYGALQFHRVDLRWRRAMGGGRLLLGITGGADWANSTLFDSAIKVRALSAAPRLIYARALGRSVDLELGANADAQTFATDVPAFQPKPSDSARSRQALSQAAYATVIIRVGERLVISPGLRADLFAEEGTSALFLEPRLDVLYKMSETLSLRVDGGRYAQMPSLPVSVPGFEAFGLADYGAQTSVGGSLGLGGAPAGPLHPRRHGLLSEAASHRRAQHRHRDAHAERPRLPGVARRSGLRGRAAPAARRYGTPLRLAGVHALLEPALRRRRRARALRLGRAAHPEPRRRLPAARRLSRSARASTSTPGAGRRSSAARRGLPAASDLLPDGSARRAPLRLRSLRDGVYADFANVTLEPEVLQLDSVNIYDSAGHPTVEQEGIKLILPPSVCTRSSEPRAGRRLSGRGPLQPPGAAAAGRLPIAGDLEAASRAQQILERLAVKIPRRDRLPGAGEVPPAGCTFACQVPRHPLPDLLPDQVPRIETSPPVEQGPRSDDGVGRCWSACADKVPRKTTGPALAVQTPRSRGGARRWAPRWRPETPGAAPPTS